MSISYRGLCEADAHGIAVFFARAANRDPNLEPMSAEQWRSFVARSYNAGGRDFVVAESDGAIVAVMTSSRQDTDEGSVRSVRIIVDPEYRRRGIANHLIDVMEAQDDDRPIVRGDTMGSWTVGSQLFERAGFRVVERCLWMSIRELPDPAPIPDGVTLREYDGDEADDRAWRRIADEGFRGSPGYSPLTPEDLPAMRAADRFHLWLADFGSGVSRAVVGFCHTKDFGGLGCVNSLAVTTSARGRGIGRALLDAGMRTLREGDPGRIRLSVIDDNEHAVALYRSVGFVVDDEIIAWQRVGGLRAQPHA